MEDKSALFLETQIKRLKRYKITVFDRTPETALGHGKFFIPHVKILSVICRLELWRSVQVRAIYDLTYNFYGGVLPLSEDNVG